MSLEHCNQNVRRVSVWCDGGTRSGFSSSRLLGTSVQGALSRRSSEEQGENTMPARFLHSRPALMNCCLTDNFILQLARLSDLLSWCKSRRPRILQGPAMRLREEI